MKFSLRAKLLSLIVGASVAALVIAKPFVFPAFPDVVERAMGGVLYIQAGGALGTGFIIDDSGLVVTNAHVVAELSDPEQLYVVSKYSSKMYQATVVAGDGLADVALLRIDGWQDFKHQVPYSVLEFAPSVTMKEGDTVWAIGMPFGFNWSFTSGYLSSLYRKMDLIDPVYFLQTDLRVTRGNSGGPLLDKNGKVVGINNAIVEVTGGEISFAIPSEIVQKIERNFKKDEKAKIVWPMLGIQYTPSPDGLGVTIAHVEPKSVADGKLAVGDRIVEVSTKYSAPFKIVNRTDLPNHTFVLDVGDQVNLKVVDKQNNMRMVSVLIGAGKTSTEFADMIAAANSKHSRRDE